MPDDNLELDNNKTKIELARIESDSIERSALIASDAAKDRLRGRRDFAMAFFFGLIVLSDVIAIAVLKGYDKAVPPELGQALLIAFGAFTAIFGSAAGAASGSGSKSTKG
jgi:hypothetical protein